jgi:acyl-homoserine-lactone acylase
VPTSASNTEILWDTWGVPHIFAPDDAGVFYAFGWAQAQAHGDLLLRLYGIARGRGAEYFGPKYLASDRLLRRMGIPARATPWAQAQRPAMRANLEAFVRGINAFARAHPERFAPEVQPVLPVTLEDLFAHIQRVYFVYLTLGGQRPTGEPFNDLIPIADLLPDAPVMGSGIAGSNAWAIAARRSRSGHSLLLANPHLYWGDYHTFFEAQLNAPGLELYGVAQVGWPVLRYGFNPHLGWAHTVNTLKGWDAYALRAEGGGYWLDGELRPFETLHQSLQVRQPDGRLREERLEVQRSLHGPVLGYQNGQPVAVRCVGLEQFPIPGIFEQYWAMGKARNLAEFESALRMQQNPMFSVLYADREGHILHLFGGLVPRRPGGDWHTWAGTLPGEDSSLIWSEVHGYDELPRLLDPESGWLQNANNPPWFTTLPAGLRAGDYPPYLAPQVMSPREQRSIRLIAGLVQEGATLEGVVEAAGSTRSELAERLLPPLLEAARGSADPPLRRAVEVLERWDRAFDPHSVGADLFSRWLVAMQPSDRLLSNLVARPWNPQEPLDTPQGLADPARALHALRQAALELLNEVGSLERPWGEVVRARWGTRDLPGHGHLDPFGVFRVSGFAPGPDGRWETVFGTTYVAAIEFSQPVRAQVLLSYGNSSQPGSRHNGDQLELFARKAMREAWLSRAAIEANLERCEGLDPSAGDAQED